MAQVYGSKDSIVITAIFIDGAFFIKRVRYFDKSMAYDAQKMAELAFTMAISHLYDKPNSKVTKDKLSHDLYRIFFYDCPPLTKKMHNPISKKAVDFSKSKEAVFRNQLHQELVKKRKTALRLGRLSDINVSWQIKPRIQMELFKGKRDWQSLTESDVSLDIIQKGVDMRIGLDIASVVLKKQANRIVLISGDSDFVPASKLARREGADFILDPMYQQIPDDLFEHIDGLRSTYPKPKKNC